MSSGLQVAGAPSALSRLRGEKPVYPQSRAGKPGNLAPSKPSSAFPKNTYNNSSMPGNAGNHLPRAPSNLGPYSRAHTRTQNSVVPDCGLPDDDFFESDSPNISQLKLQDKQKFTQNFGEESKANGRQSIVGSMASLSVGPPKQAEPVPMGRCMGWERPVGTSSIKSRASKYAPRSDRDHPNPMNSEYSISYKRRANQTPMEQAGYREYLPFLKSEFKIGTIIRMNIHEADFKGTSKEAIVQASQASTLVDGGKGGRRRKEHRHHGDFGPIYSENRIFIVVNVARSIYSAVPLFTHEGNGLAKTNPDERGDWISVQDHRQLDRCQQQSEHPPLRTAYMNPQADVLNAVSTAWIPYAFPCRFDVPVAYQGVLDSASAERLVRLHRNTWDGEAK